MSSFLALLVFFVHGCISDEIEEDFFFDDLGAWILCRKIVDGVNGNFGVGYDFTVTYELTNIGTQKAHNIKIEDNWDWEFVQRSRDSVELLHPSLSFYVDRLFHNTHLVKSECHCI